MGNFTAPAALKILDVIPDVHNITSTDKKKSQTVAKKNTVTAGTIIPIYQHMQSGDTRKHTNDPLYEPMTNMSRVPARLCATIYFLYVPTHNKGFLTGTICRQCDRTCVARCAVKRRCVIRGHAKLGITASTTHQSATAVHRTPGS